MSDYDHNCLYIGGLNPDLTTDKLKQDLKHMLKCIDIHVKLNQLRIVNNRKTGNCYGFVYLDNRGDVDYVLGNLSTLADRQNVPFDFSKIQHPNKPLKCNYKMQHRHLSHFAYYPMATTTDVSNLSLPNPVRIQKTNKQMVMAVLVSDSPPNPPERYYRLSERLGNETGIMEFKQGSSVTDDRILQETIGNYVCAFLNTDVGGTLLIGVDDDGLVIGLICDKTTEDKYRLSIDHAIKDISPLVPSEIYTVDFVPVLDQSNSFSLNLYVLEIKVYATETHIGYYMYKDKVYIHKDGSAQMLDSQGQIEWVTKHNSQTLEQVQSVLMGFTAELQVLQKEKTWLECELDTKKQEQTKEDEEHTEALRVQQANIAQLEHKCNMMKQEMALKEKDYTEQIRVLKKQIAQQDTNQTEQPKSDNSKQRKSKLCLIL